MVTVNSCTKLGPGKFRCKGHIISPPGHQIRGGMDIQVDGIVEQTGVHAGGEPYGALAEMPALTSRTVPVIKPGSVTR